MESRDAASQWEVLLSSLSCGGGSVDQLRNPTPSQRPTLVAAVRAGRYLQALASPQAAALLADADRLPDAASGSDHEEAEQLYDRLRSRVHAALDAASDGARDHPSSHSACGPAHWLGLGHGARIEIRGRELSGDCSTLASCDVWVAADWGLGFSTWACVLGGGVWAQKSGMRNGPRCWWLAWRCCTCSSRPTSPGALAGHSS